MSALLLAIVLVVGGWMLPAYDAIVFHGPRPTQSGPVRVESTGASQGHLVQCLLGQQYQRTRIAPPPSPALLHLPPAPVVFTRARGSIPPSAPPATQLSRAPPTYTA